jgi:hypothetical protein
MTAVTAARAGIGTGTRTGLSPLPMTMRVA